MKLFDTDCFTDIVRGLGDYTARFEAMARADRCIPIVVAEEILRGWLAKIRDSHTKGNAERIVWAYGKLHHAIEMIRGVRIVPYTPAAHEHYLRLKSLKIRIGTRDLRIASIALADDATLITRNRRDYELVPSLQLEVWN